VALVIDAVIFDCDGTLVDSEPLSRAAWDQVLEPFGYATRDDEYPDLVGRPFPYVHAFLAERVTDLPGAEPLWAAYSDALFTLIDVRLEPFVDALDTLGELRARGVRVAVASSSMRERLDHTLRRAGLADAFAVSVAGDEIEHGKPAPDMFLAAADRLGVAPAACAVIEDSAPGVAAARAAGMRTVGVARANDDAAAVAGADVVVERLTPRAVLDA
jgi:HAD superfamily hydrolase (TIGR01509 family)